LELLSHKTDLFDGVFGASDKVLGTVAGGVGLERKIHRIFQTCRKPEQIAEEFKRLREELDEAVVDDRARAVRHRAARRPVRYAYSTYISMLIIPHIG
jgi:hypothetical protein